MAGQALPVVAQGTPGESSRQWSLTLCSSSSEEVILAEDETDGEQRHPFDGNCSEPGSGGPQGRWGNRRLGPKGCSGGGCSGSRWRQEQT